MKLSEIFGRRRARHKGAALEEHPQSSPEPAGPPLVLLVNDASRCTTYRVHTFPDARAAAAFIEFWFASPHTRRGLLAYWALPYEPDGDGEVPFRAEGVVLIRDVAGSDLACPFSFDDFDSGLAFLRAEMAKGLDPRLVLLHRAVPIAVECGQSGEARLSPVRPPVRRPEGRARAESSAAAAPVAEPSPAPVRRRQERGVLAATPSPARAEAFQGFGSPQGRF